MRNDTKTALMAPWPALSNPLRVTGVGSHKCQPPYRRMRGHETAQDRQRAPPIQSASYLQAETATIREDLR